MTVRTKLSSTLWRLAAFLTVCTFGTVGLISIFGQLRFNDESMYHAVFTTVTGLQEDNFVRIAGVEVGRVERISINDDATAVVNFTVDDSVILTGGSTAVVRYDNLIGGRYLELEEGAGETRQLRPGDTIPLDRTAPALDLDALIGGFRPLFRALDPDQVNALTGQLLAAFQGQGATIGGVLTQTASLTNTLADRDELIGEVVANLGTVLDSLGDHSEQFGDAIDSLAQLMDALEHRGQDLTTGLAYANEAAGTTADLLAQARPPLNRTLTEVGRTSNAIMAEGEYFDNLLATLPAAYRVLNRQGLSGNFFNFYLCDLVLKLNGKGGQPVYVKVAGQDTGRCTPE